MHATPPTTTGCRGCARLDAHPGRGGAIAPGRAPGCVSGVVGSVLAIGLAAVTGCSSVPATVEALAKDPAIVTVDVMTPWGSLHYTRNATNLTGGAVSHP